MKNSNYLTPRETADYIIELSHTKATMPVMRRMLLSIMAGAFISLGAQGYLTLYEFPFARAAVFPVGLMMIVLVGGELFTGNCMMTFGLLHKKINVKDFFISIMQVLLGNLIGALSIILLLYYSGIYSPDAAMTNIVIKITNAKLSLTFVQALTKGILCNILVALGVWFAYTAKDTTGKLMACWFPITLFVISGYEHVVANMFYMPLSALLSSDVSILSMIINNFIPVAIGNFIGGGLIVPLIYYKIYYK